MIKYQKTSPVGIDVFVNRVQVLQQREFPDLFGVNEATCLFYPRAEIIDDKYVVYAVGNSYKDVEIDKKYNFISYLVPVGNYEFDASREGIDVSFFCHGNMANLYSSITHRADEEFRLDMKNFILCQIEPQDFKNIEPIEGMQPFHSFKVNFKLNF